MKQHRQKLADVPPTLKNWKQEESRTETRDNGIISSTWMSHKVKDCGDDLDNLDILSLCGGTTDEYDITEDDYLSDDRKLDKSIDTTSSYTKSSSTERDDNSDVVILRNHNISNRAPSACSLPQESIRLYATSQPIHCSDKSLHGVKSEFTSSSSGGKSAISNSSRIHHPQRGPFVLNLRNESYHNVLELPSPSSASLHSGHGNITMQEFIMKSNSAPILLKKDRNRDDFVGKPIVSYFDS